MPHFISILYAIYYRINTPPFIIYISPYTIAIFETADIFVITLLCVQVVIIIFACLAAHEPLSKSFTVIYDPAFGAVVHVSRWNLAAKFLKVSTVKGLRLVKTQSSEQIEYTVCFRWGNLQSFGFGQERQGERH